MDKDYQGKTIQQIMSENCTGCGACYNACPAGAITMKPDKEGFLAPSVDHDKCVLCSKCLSVCQATRQPELYKKQDCYALAVKDNDLRKKSSSGGAFSVLSGYVLQKGGVVCGAVYSDDYQKVYHAWAADENDLGRIRGSKYVQSDTLKTYAETKEYLEQGKYVLYTGTPCQIYGLQCFLGKPYDSLITADIVCHGTPSPEVYRKYLAELSEGKTIKRLDFRDKNKWGWGTATSLFFTDNSAYYGDCYNDEYWKAFLGGMSTRKCCGYCRFAKINRIGDFTIGDFWGIQELDPEYGDGKGTSLLFANSPKAKEIFSQLPDDTFSSRKFAAETVENLARRRNGQLVGPKAPHEQRPVLFEKMEKGEPFIKTFREVTKKYDVGYIGWWDSKNYGSALTSFAMNRTLKSMGKTVLMLEHPGILPGRAVDSSYGMKFARKYYTCSEITKEKDFARFNYCCNNFLVGSDQLWNWWNINGSNPDFFFLNFAWNSKKRIAYATSFGMDHTSFPEYMRIRVGYYLSKFDYISTREKSGVDICRDVFGVDADFVLDPVFLCPKEDYSELIGSSKLKFDEKPYLFSYILDPTADKLNLVREVAKRKGLSYKIAVDGLGSEEFIRTTLKNDSNIMSRLCIEDWLSLLYHSSYVVTDSFHGFCFSMIFEKQAIAYVNVRRGAERFISITDLLGVRERLTNSSEDALGRNLDSNEIDFAVIRNIIAEKKQESMDWLTHALEAPKKEMTVKELNRWKIREHDKLIRDIQTAIGEGNSSAPIRDELRELEQRISELESNYLGVHKSLTRLIGHEIKKAPKKVREGFNSLKNVKPVIKKKKS